MSFESDYFNYSVIVNYTNGILNYATNMNTGFDTWLEMYHLYYSVYIYILFSWSIKYFCFILAWNMVSSILSMLGIYSLVTKQYISKYKYYKQEYHTQNKEYQECFNKLILLKQDCDNVQKINITLANTIKSYTEKEFENQNNVYQNKPRRTASLNAIKKIKSLVNERLV